jgi:hypothetical protein
VPGAQVAQSDGDTPLLLESDVPAGHGVGLVLGDGQ